MLSQTLIACTDYGQKNRHLRRLTLSTTSSPSRYSIASRRNSGTSDDFIEITAPVEVMDGAKRAERRTNFMLALKQTIAELGVQYVLPTQVREALSFPSPSASNFYLFWFFLRFRCIIFSLLLTPHSLLSARRGCR